MDNTQPQSGNTSGGSQQVGPSGFGAFSPEDGLNMPRVQQVSGPSPEFLSHDDFVDPTPKRHLKTLLIRISLGLILLLTLAGGVLIAVRKGTVGIQSGDFSNTHISLDSLPKASELATSATQTLTVNGQLQVGDSLVLTPSGQPDNPTAGQIYYNQDTNNIAYYNGKQFLNLAGTTSNIQNTTNVTNVFNSSTGTVSSISGTGNVIPKFSGDEKTLSGSILTDMTNYLQIAGGLNLIVPTNISDLSFWDSSVVPQNPNATDTNGGVELGAKFTVDVPGIIKALRFYKGTTSTGPYVGSLWTSGGTLLARATFTTSSTGWQQVDLTTPVSISTNTTYVVSYHSQGGGYAADNDYFGSGGVDNGPLHALASGLDGGNGVFKYSSTSTFPNQTFSSTNYYADVVFSGATYPTTSLVRINGAQIASSDLGDSNNIARRSASQVFSGHNIFRNGSDSADAFTIQKSDTTAVFTADTLNSRIYIGPGTGSTTGVLLILSSKTNNAIDPTGVDGAMYYNLTLESFRCYSDGQWSECGTLNATHNFSLYDEFMGGQTTSFGTNNIIGSLGWNAQAIGANGSINFNPGTPTPIADRPGVLALQTPAVSDEGTTLMLANGNGKSMIIQSGNDLRTAVAVGAATNQVLRVGLHDETTTTTQPVSGVWWEADPSASANWRYCYGDGTTATCAASGVAIAANTWVRLEIRVTATGTGTSAVSFYINGASAASLTAITIDTTNRVSPAYTCYTQNTSAQSCYWDYFQLNGITSAAR